MSIQQGQAKSAAPRFGRLDAALADVRIGNSSLRDYLLARQHPEGYWCGELEADSMLEADYIFLHTLLESGDPERLKRACTEMMRYQKEDGSWSLYPGGPGNVSLSVKCYFSAKLMNIPATDPRLVKCREWILAHGGVVECNTFTKMYLCALGQYDYDAVPAIPPEIVLFPNWFYFNIYEISAWSRSILVPLAIIYAKKPYKKIPPEHGIDELFVGGRANANLRLRMGSQEDDLVAQFLHRDRSHHALGRGGAHSSAAQAGAEEGGEVDAGAAGDVRRSGRHLSGHAQRDHCAALPGLLRRRSAGDPRARRI